MVTVFSTRAPAPVRLRRDVEPRVAVGAAVGLFETSGDVDNCANRVDAVINALDADAYNYMTATYGAGTYGSVIVAPTRVVPDSMHDQFVSDRAFFHDWRAFYDEWKSWKRDWDGRIISILSADAFRECGKYDDEARVWHDKTFPERGITTTAPATEKPSPLPGILPNTAPGETSWGTYLFWGLVIGGVIAAAMLVGNLRKLAS